MPKHFSPFDGKPIKLQETCPANLCIMKLLLDKDRYTDGASPKINSNFHHPEQSHHLFELRYVQKVVSNDRGELDWLLGTKVCVPCHHEVIQQTCTVVEGNRYFKQLRKNINSMFKSKWISAPLIMITASTPTARFAYPINTPISQTRTVIEDNGYTPLHSHMAGLIKEKLEEAAGNDNPGDYSKIIGELQRQFDQKAAEWLEANTAGRENPIEPDPKRQKSTASAVVKRQEPSPTSSTPDEQEQEVARNLVQAFVQQFSEAEKAETNPGVHEAPGNTAATTRRHPYGNRNSLTSSQLQLATVFGRDNNFSVVLYPLEAEPSQHEGPAGTAETAIKDIPTVTASPVKVKQPGERSKVALAKIADAEISNGAFPLGSSLKSPRMHNRLQQYGAVKVECGEALHVKVTWDMLQEPVPQMWHQTVSISTEADIATTITDQAVIDDEKITWEQHFRDVVEEHLEVVYNAKSKEEKAAAMEFIIAASPQEIRQNSVNYLVGVACSNIHSGEIHNTRLVKNLGMSKVVGKKMVQSTNALQLAIHNQHIETMMSGVAGLKLDDDLLCHLFKEAHTAEGLKSNSEWQYVGSGKGSFAPMHSEDGRLGSRNAMYTLEFDGKAEDTPEWLPVANKISAQVWVCLDDDEAEKLMHHDIAHHSQQEAYHASTLAPTATLQSRNWMLNWNRMEEKGAAFLAQYPGQVVLTANAHQVGKVCAVTSATNFLMGHEFTAKLSGVIRRHDTIRQHRLGKNKTEALEEFYSNPLLHDNKHIICNAQLLVCVADSMPMIKARMCVGHGGIASVEGRSGVDLTALTLVAVELEEREIASVTKIAKIMCKGPSSWEMTHSPLDSNEACHFCGTHTLFATLKVTTSGKNTKTILCPQCTEIHLEHWYKHKLEPNLRVAVIKVDCSEASELQLEKMFKEYTKKQSSKKGLAERGRENRDDFS